VDESCDYHGFKEGGGQEGDSMNVSQWVVFSPAPERWYRAVSLGKRTSMKGTARDVCHLVRMMKTRVRKQTPTSSDCSCVHFLTCNTGDCSYLLCPKQAKSAWSPRGLTKSLTRLGEEDEKGGGVGGGACVLGRGGG